MSELVAIGFFLIGITFALAGKSFLEVAACFLIYGVCHGAYELYLIRKEMEDDDNA